MRATSILRLLTLTLISLLTLSAVHENRALADQSFSRSQSFLAGRFDSGPFHSCAIGGDGTVHCWGYGEYGELGYGNTAFIGDDELPSSAGAVNLGAGRTAVAISAGSFQSCAILDNGTVKCWGAGAHGRLGYGNTNSIGDNETPGSVGSVDLGAGRTATAISTNETHTCAILDNGSLRCWGGNDYGQLGYGNTNSVGDNETPGSVGPVDLGAGRTAVAVSAGYIHTCAILDNGTVRCWGSNASGQLGTGTSTIGDNETPGSIAPVDLGAGRTAVAISAGYLHTCAILDNGTAKCWGSGEDGRLGYGNTNSVPIPSAVGTVDLGTGRTAVAISAGLTHTCAVLDDGLIRCWGDPDYGKLGYGNTKYTGDEPVGDNEMPGSVNPIDVGPGRKGVAVTANQDSTCALLDNGSIRCWGEGLYGKLGYGNTFVIGDNETPGTVGPVDIGSGHGVLETAAGTTHTCARFDTGEVRCWGNGADGRLGYANTRTIGDDENPGAEGTVDLGGRSALEITAGSNHTCALLDNGAIRCWGLGDDGRLGYGNTNSVGDDETPGSIAAIDLGGVSATAVAAGGSHTCAVLTNGTVRCWGSGANGRLGYGNTSSIGDNEAPGSAAPVALGRSGVGIDVGTSHACTRLDDGTVRCWGFGGAGALGYAGTGDVGDNEPPSTVGPVSVGRSAVAVAAGGDHTCTRLDNGTMRCWGLNSFGQLGYANTATIGDNEPPSAAGPVDLGAGRAAAGIATGASHTCAVLDNGTVRCWGNGADGRLGYANTTTIGDNETPGAVGSVDLGGGLNALDVSAGGAHTCTALTNGTVRCWGLNSSGQLGYGNTNSIGDNETPGSAGGLDFVDDPPVAVNDLATVDEDVLTAIDVFANDTDVDGGPKKIESKTNGAHGTVTITGGGSGLSYLSSSNYCGADSFTYTLKGGSSATVSITVICVDDLPVAVNDSASTSEDASPLAIDVLANDTDVDLGPKTIQSVVQPPHGSVSITDGGLGLSYQPVANYCNAPPATAPDSFTYTLNGGSSATVSVTVTCVEDDPVAVNDSTGIAEDASATAIDVLGNDTDADGGVKTITAKTDPLHGAVAITGGGSSLTYQPAANYCGSDSFTYTLNGGSSATVSVTVTCVDDPPVAVSDSKTVEEDASATAIDVLTNDTDIDLGPKTIQSVTQPAHGTVAVTGGGSDLTYQPAANYCGSDSFTYTLNGGASATVSVTVTCVDDPPVAVGDLKTLDEDSSATAIDVLTNDTDLDAGPKTIASKADGAHGTVLITGGGTGLTYQPAVNYCGADSFTYTLNGGSTANVSITVTCVDDQPVAVNDADTVAEDSGATAIDVLANDADVDGGTKLVTGKTNGSNGAVSIIGGGAGITYTPNADYCGADSFTYTLNGGSSATVSVTVTCVDDPLPPGEEKGSPQGPTTVIQTPQGASGPVVTITPGVGVVSGRRHPRIAIKGTYAFFTLTCRLADRDCSGTVSITANLPSVTLGPTIKALTLIKGKFRIGAGRSVLVRAKLTKHGREALEAKKTLRGVTASMAIVDIGNGERGEIDVNLVRRPKASLLGGQK